MGKLNEEMILHFSKSDELSDLVVLDPQWLVDALTKVIRDFDLHEDDMALEAEMKFTTDFDKLKEEAIASVNLLNFFWKGEDGESEIDFARRKFLPSLVESHTIPLLLEMARLGLMLTLWGISGLSMVAITQSLNCFPMEPTLNRAWVTNQNGETVSVLDNNGTSITTITIESKPFGIAKDKNGNIWVTSSSVLKLSSSSNNLGTTLGTFNTGNAPQCIAFDSKNQSWITMFNGTLVNLDNNRNFIGTFAIGTGATYLIGVAVDSNDDIWAVAHSPEPNTISVYKFSNNGTSIGNYTAGNNPSGIAIDSSNNAWITNTGDNTVTKLSNSGIHLQLYNVGEYPQFLAFDLSGNTWVTDSDSSFVTEIEQASTSAPTKFPTKSPTHPTRPPTTPIPTTPNPTTFAPTTPVAASLSSAETIGIAVGVSFVGIASAVALVLCFRRKGRFKDESKAKEKNETSEENVPFAMQIDGSQIVSAIPASSSSKKSIPTSRSAQSQIHSDGISTIQVAKLLKIKPHSYVLKEKIGSGGFSQVSKVEHITKGKENEIYAFKQFTDLSLDSLEAEKIKEEIETLALLDHPNIIKLIGVSDDPNSVDGNDKSFGVGIMMEYCENGSWRNVLDKDPFPKMDLVNHIIFGVTNGMNYLHLHQPKAIIHRDLKSDNVLLDKSMNAKICDFGLSIVSETIASKGKSNAGGTTGTLQYKAPETFEGRFGLESDVYAFGCVIFESLSGKRPWDGLADTQIVKRIVVGTSLDTSVIRSDSSPELVQLMKQCLDYQKEKRPSFPEIKAEIEKLNPPKEIEKKYLAFVSHHKIPSASALATILKKSLEESLQQAELQLKVFVDQEQHRLDLSQLLVHLQESKVIVLLLTKEVFTDHIVFLN